MNPDNSQVDDTLEHITRPTLQNLESQVAEVEKALAATLEARHQLLHGDAPIEIFEENKDRRQKLLDRAARLEYKCHSVLLLHDKQKLEGAQLRSERLCVEVAMAEIQVLTLELQKSDASTSASP